MNKALNKIVLKCILTVCVIFVPFIFANYFITNYFLEHGEDFLAYDTIILNVIQIIIIVAAGLIIRYRNKSVITENIYSTKIYLIGSQIAILIVVLMFFSGIYTDLYYITSETLNILENESVFAVICWEQLFNGKFIFEILFCISICFIPKIRKKQEF